MTATSPDLATTVRQTPDSEKKLQTTDQHGTDLHGKVGDALAVMGHSSQTVPEGERPIFTGGDAVEALGNEVVNGIADRFSEPTLETGARVSPSRRFGRWVLDRMRRLKGLQNK